MYKPTALESWISKIYIRKGVLEPGDLSRDNIEKVFGFDYYVMRSPAYFIDNMVVVDKREPFPIQREQFFHELCHFLRHSPCAGMPKMYRQLIEWEARNFIKYAAIPFHMLDYVDKQNPLISMSEIFDVSLEICRERIELIKNQFIERKMMKC